MASRIVKNSHGEPLTTVEDVVYYAGTEELLKRDLDSRFGQEPMDLVWNYVEEAPKKQKMDRRGKPLIDKYGRPVMIPLEKNDRERNIDAKIGEIVRNNDEIGNKNTVLPDNQKQKPLPVIYGLKWHDAKYAYVELCMDKELWNMLNSRWSKIKHKFSDTLRRVTNNTNASTIAKNITGSVPSAAQLGALALHGFLSQKMNNVAAKTNQRREWREQEKRQKRNVQNSNRRANDPLQAKLGYTGNRTQMKSKSSVSSKSVEPKYSWERSYSGKDIDQLKNDIASSIGEGIAFGRTKIHGMQLQVFNNKVYNTPEELESELDNWKRNKSNEPHFFITAYMSSKNKVIGNIMADPETAERLEQYVSRTVRENTKITLSIGQLRRLINECR